jgi:hypothetical protein
MKKMKPLIVVISGILIALFLGGCFLMISFIRGIIGKAIGDMDKDDVVYAEENDEPLHI